MSRYSSLTSSRLREAMNNKQLTAQELSNLSGVSKSSISQYLSGKTSPTNNNAAKIAQVLDVEIDWLLGIEKDVRVLGTDVTVSDDVKKEFYMLMETATKLDKYFLDRLLKYANKLKQYQDDL